MPLSADDRCPVAGDAPAPSAGGGPSTPKGRMPANHALPLYACSDEDPTLGSGGVA